ncbi:MAG: hypothetical protein FGM24_04060 [Candidatus Kapabacteria bacterium]|nr:hypothetical protein [Candidatus Kapabacteria bacterium]
MNDETMRHAQPPNLAKARAYTRVLGPAAIVGGSATTLLGIVLTVLGGGVLATIIVAYGIVSSIFGLAAWARTESIHGVLARWAVVIVFLLSGGLALLQWAELLWGSRWSTSSMNMDLTVLGFYLMAGPALIVPGILAALRPAWVPLIVAPAIVAMASTAVVGLAVITMIGMSIPALDTVPHGMGTILMVIVAVVAAAVLLWPMKAMTVGADD